MKRSHGAFVAMLAALAAVALAAAHAPAAQAQEQPWSISISPEFASIRYFEDFTGVAFAGTSFVRLHGEMTAPGYGVRVNIDRQLAPQWGLGINLEGLWSTPGNEPFTAHQDLSPSGLPNFTVDQSYQQSLSTSLVGGNLLVSFTPSGSGPLTVFGLAGWRQMALQITGGSYTITQCSPSCSTSKGLLPGGATETFTSPAWGLGARYEIPLRGDWTMAIQAQYASLPTVNVTNNQLGLGSPLTLGTSGSEWRVRIGASHPVSDQLTVTIALDGSWTRINTSSLSNPSVFYPGGGWDAYILSVQGTYRF